MPEKPPAIEDLGIAAKALKGEAAKREEIFQKSFAEQKTRQSLLDKKFDGLSKQAKDVRIRPRLNATSIFSESRQRAENLEGHARSTTVRGTADGRNRSTREL